MTPTRKQTEYKTYSPLQFFTQHPERELKMALLLLLAMLTVCAAMPQDLTGKMFTFPQQTNSAQVRMTLSGQNLRAVSVCFRSFTDLRRGHSLFSLSTPSSDNAYLIFKEAGNNVISFWTGNKETKFGEQDCKLNTWLSICSTWDSVSGVGQLWIDGKPSTRRFISSGTSISGTIIIVLGQEQDSHGGGFDINQSFVGMMTDVHMWDYVISPREIQDYAQAFVSFTPGNVLNWGALNFQTTGRVLIEDKQLIHF